MPQIPEYLTSPLMYLAATLVLVFLICQEFIVMRAAIAHEKPFAALVRGVRTLFFSAIVIGLAVFAFMQSVWVGAAVVVAASLGVVGTLVLLPRLGAALQGAVGSAVTGGVMAIFGMGMSAFALIGKNYDSLLGGVVLTGVGGWMLYAAIKKMGQGE